MKIEQKIIKLCKNMHPELNEVPTEEIDCVIAPVPHHREFPDLEGDVVIASLCRKDGKRFDGVLEGTEIIFRFPRAMLDEPEEELP